LSDLQDPFENLFGQRVEAIADDHRQSGQGQFKRDGARRGERGAARREGIVLILRPLHDDRLPRPALDGFDNRRRHRPDRWYSHAETADQALQTVQRCSENRQQTRHLGVPAPGERRDKQIILREPVCYPEPATITPVCTTFEHGMANKATRQSDLLEIRRLKRQQRHQMVVPACHATGPPGTPCPDHRGHVVNKR